MDFWFFVVVIVAMYYLYTAYENKKKYRLKERELRVEEKRLELEKMRLEKGRQEDEPVNSADRDNNGRPVI